ncbi:MAG: tyrosine-type recombinase/integrase, partial [Mycobacterium sp.]
VHEIPGQGSWLKIPLGKLDTERMVPLDDQVLTVIDRITTTRSPGRPMRHPRTGAPADFLFTHHGKRLSQNAVRAELNRAATAAGLGHVTTHQLRHTYATALNLRGIASDASFGSRGERCGSGDLGRSLATQMPWGCHSTRLLSCVDARHHTSRMHWVQR